MLELKCMYLYVMYFYVMYLVVVYKLRHANLDTFFNSLTTTTPRSAPAPHRHAFISAFELLLQDPWFPPLNPWRNWWKTLQFLHYQISLLDVICQGFVVFSVAFIGGNLIEEEPVDVVPLQVLGDVALHVVDVAFAVQRVDVTHNLESEHQGFHRNHFISWNIDLG